jgi:hypothetical protein
MSDLLIDSNGWFEPNIGTVAPAEWPWALPSLYCVNLAEDPGEEIASYSAKLDDSSKAVSRLNGERHRVETVGYWNNSYRVVELQRFRTKSRAERYATDQFRCLPVRYLMHSGKVIDERPDVVLNGEWPLTWNFRSVRDLGVFCAYVYENAMIQGAKDFAQEFRASIVPGWPLHELIANYRKSLVLAKQHAELWAADSRDMAGLNLAIDATLTLQS